MKKKSLIIVALLSIILYACEEPTNTTQIQIHKGAGTVDFDHSSIRDLTTFDMYHFGSFDSITPGTKGFKSGDQVYFEAEKMYWNGNDNGGTTYWCKLLLIRKFN